MSAGFPHIKRIIIAVALSAAMALEAGLAMAWNFDIDWPKIISGAQGSRDIPPVFGKIVATAPEEEDALYALLVQAFFSRSEGVFDYGVHDPQGVFRVFYPRFRTQALANFPPQAGPNSLMEAKDGQQRSHILSSEAGITGFVLHSWFRTPKSLRDNPPPYMKDHPAVTRGFFYAVYPMTAEEVKVFAGDVRDQMDKEPDNYPLRSYYYQHIEPELAPEIVEP